MLTNFTYKKSQTNPYGVLVSITMSKEFTIDVLKNRDREVDESDVRLDKFLPDEILNAVANQDNKDLKNILKNMKTDAADWNIDNITIIEHISDRCWSEIPWENYSCNTTTIIKHVVCIRNIR